MAAVIARLQYVDSKEFHPHLIGVREAPFPGDTIKLVDGTVVRVLRREFNELATAFDTAIPDVILGIRLA